MVCEMRKLLEAADRMVICEEDLDPLALVVKIQWRFDENDCSTKERITFQHVVQCSSFRHH